MRNVVNVRAPADRRQGSHSRASASRWPAMALVAAVLAVTAAVTTAWLLHGGRPGSQRQPASHGDSASVSPARSALPGSSVRRPHADPLAGEARSYLASRSGTVLAAVYDEHTGQTWTLGQETPQDEASIVKVDILETLLAQHNASGATLSARQTALARRMIEDSDNDAATTLWGEVGGATGIRSYNASAGLTHTRPSSCVACPGFPWPGWGLSTTTPDDQLTLLRQLLQANQQLSDAQRAFALGLMEHVTPSQRWGVTGGVPLAATVAVKNGWLPLTSADDDWQINSIGWISGRGRDYLIAVLTSGDPGEQYGIDTIDDLSAMVWRLMR
jgi:Beta-lactamase enzyme family